MPIASHNHKVINLTSLLTAEQLIALIRQEIFKEHTVSSPDISFLSNLQRLKSRLKSMYFPELREASEQDVLQELVSNSNFYQEYPKLYSLLKMVFSAPSEEFEREFLAISTSDSLKDWSLSPEIALAKFIESQNEYGVWITDTDPSVFEVFSSLAESSRKIAICVEKCDPSDDWIAFEYAYKMMALFWNHAVYHETGGLNSHQTFQKIARQAQKLIANANTAKSYYNVFLAKIKLPHANNLQDLQGWRLFLMGSQDKKIAFDILKMAVEIEKVTDAAVLRRAPKDLAEAKLLVVKASYKRAIEDFDFASLCYQYKVSEPDFDRCLDYLYKNQPGKSSRYKKWPPSMAGWPKKDPRNDNIPNVMISGEGDAAGYYLAKLPADDKRGLIIGNITHCCETFGGFSESCVRDALQRPDNGRYIILKARHTSEQSIPKFPLDDEGRYKIVGQSYAWRSKSGGLCLDSLECLRDQVPDKVAQILLQKFANTLMHNNSQVRFVTLGSGGKTPEGLFPAAAFAEQMRQGYQDSDSLEQYLIAQKYLLDKEPYASYFNDQVFDYVNYISAFFDHRELFHQAIIDFGTQVRKPSLQIKRLKLLKEALLESEAPIEISMLLPQQKARLAEQGCSTVELLMNTHSAAELADILTHNEFKRKEVVLKVAIDTPELLADFIRSYPQQAFLVEENMEAYTQVELNHIAASMNLAYCQLLQQLNAHELEVMLRSFPAMTAIVHQYSRRPYQIMLSTMAAQPHVFKVYFDYLCQAPNISVKPLYQSLSTGAAFENIYGLLMQLPPERRAEPEKLFINLLLTNPFTALEFFQQCSEKGLSFYDHLFDMPVGTRSCHIEEAARYKYINMLMQMPPEDLKLFLRNYPFLHKYINNLFTDVINRALADLSMSPESLGFYFDFCYKFCKPKLLAALKKTEYVVVLELFLSYLESDLAQGKADLEQELSVLPQCLKLNFRIQDFLLKAVEQPELLSQHSGANKIAADLIEQMSLTELKILSQKYPLTFAKILERHELLRNLFELDGNANHLEKTPCLILQKAHIVQTDKHDKKRAKGGA